MNVSNPTVTARRAWDLEVTRVIAFPTQPAIFLEQHWWQDVVRTAPARSESAQDRREECGRFEDAFFSLIVEPSHILWQAQPLEVEDPFGNVAVLGAFPRKLGWFVEVLSHWLAGACPPLIRLALSARLLRPASSLKEAYRDLAAYLPGVKDALESEPAPNDFLFQVNRRRPSNVVAELEINRMCTWSKINSAVRVEPGRPFEWPRHCYSALHLDINTAPENFAILPSASLPLLLEELAALANDVAEEGDVP